MLPFAKPSLEGRKLVLLVTDGRRAGYEVRFGKDCCALGNSLPFVKSISILALPAVVIVFDRVQQTALLFPVPL